MLLMSACVSIESIGTKGCDVVWTATLDNGDPFDPSNFSIKVVAKDAETGENLGQETFHYTLPAGATREESGTFRLNRAPVSGRARLSIYDVLNNERIGVVEVPVEADACWVDPEWTFSVDQVDSTGMPETGVPDPDGALACGLFDVLTHGEKTVDLSLYPDCPAASTVYCMNAVGEWTDIDVHDVAISDDGILTFTSTQEGLCGLFPAE